MTMTVAPASAAPADASSKGRSSRSLSVPYLSPLDAPTRLADLQAIQKYAHSAANYSLQLHAHLQALCTGSQTGSQARPYDPESMMYRETGRRTKVKEEKRGTPKEERALAQQRKSLAFSESTRETLETQYMSLRAHYVSASQRLASSRLSTDAACKALQGAGGRRGKAVAFRRARLAVAREIERVVRLRKENWGGADIEKLIEKTRQDASKMEFVSKTQKLWDKIENALAAAEQGCADPTQANLVADALAGRYSRNDSGSNQSARRGRPLKPAASNAAKLPILWENSVAPQTPRGQPLLLSPLSSFPDKSAAVAYAGAFGSSPYDLAWFEPGLPSSNVAREKDQDSLSALRAECARLSALATDLRLQTLGVQRIHNERRKETEVVNAELGALRTETEAVLNRHHLVLDTPEAKRASSTLREQEEARAAEALKAQEAETESQNGSDDEEDDDEEGVNGG
eukprot:CAMPEP_0182455468 /NCGR_PEP_ID=MMETSP1319-20130603/1617_1 /TAXON_ID=172717 /ORGANISM="Bolidomonas pacifica, Strain RCC208" /LENGTH=458 /DNA_ID=CAMNT_0024653527 /DNA_START=134 /DNA_END=1506 /DNA_ORIENTATION=-